MSEYTMKKLFLYLLGCLLGQHVLAHPHAFIDMKTKVLVDKQQLVGFSMQWILDEPSSAAVLYDVKQAKSDKKALQKLIDEVIGNVVNEHYFSYLFDKQGNKVKYSAKPQNYGMKSSGAQVLYYFDTMFPCITISLFIRPSIFLNYRKIAMAKCWSLISMKNLKLTPPR